MVSKIDRSLKNRLITVISGQMALQRRNGRANAFVSLKTIYKILKAETNSEKAQIRGILNSDYIKNKKTFDREVIEGKKRNGMYRLHVEPITDNTPIEIIEGAAA